MLVNLSIAIIVYIMHFTILSSLNKNHKERPKYQDLLDKSGLLKTGRDPTVVTQVGQYICAQLAKMWADPAGLADLHSSDSS